MLSYKDALDYTYNLYGKLGLPQKYGLEKIQKALCFFGNPQDDGKFVHIAGTKGKGSTTNFLSSILKENKYKTGMYISPSLINTSERISINGKLITPKQFTAYIRKLKEYYDKWPIEEVPSTFETFTIVALLYFKENLTDINLLEVGLGGRLDATNVISNPIVSVITEISYDHQKVLGNTLKNIASEKAGIIKRGHPVVIGSDISEAKETIISIAKNQSADYFVIGKDFFVSNVKLSKNGSVFNFDSPSLGIKLKELSIKLSGIHQVRNAAVAIQTILLLNSQGFNICEDSLRAGLRGAFWPGRFETINQSPLVVIDGAHNESSALVLAETLKLLNKKVVFLFSMLSDKNIDEVIRALAPMASKFYITEVPLSYGRRMNAILLYEHASQFLDPSKIIMDKNPRRAYLLAKRDIRKNEVLCVTGSLYLVGFIRYIEKIFTFSCDML